MSVRRPAFDPSRLDDELDELLPPAPSTSLPGQPATIPEPTGQPQGEAAPQPDRVRPERQDDLGETQPRAARGAGGRPEGSRDVDSSDRSTVTAVRISKPLYDAVVHDLLGGLVERPSYAQIVAWTCEDHTEEVIAELAHAVTTSARAPRGRKLASDGVPLALRFRSTERASLDDVIRRTRGDAAKITRTAGVSAALRVAVKYGIPAASSRS